MAKGKRLDISLTKSGDIDKAIEWLKSYKTELRSKTEIFADRLAELGIDYAASSIAQNGSYASYISFSKVDDSSGDIVSVIIRGSDTQEVISQWWHNGQIVENSISPILMAEFGASFLFELKDYGGEVPAEAKQGSNSLFGHGFDSEFHWKERGGTWHSTADEDIRQEMTPSHPMYNAMQAMLKQATAIAKEVFDG